MTATATPSATPRPATRSWDEPCSTTPCASGLAATHRHLPTDGFQLVFARRCRRVAAQSGQTSFAYRTPPEVLVAGRIGAARKSLRHQPPAGGLTYFDGGCVLLEPPYVESSRRRSEPTAPTRLACGVNDRKLTATGR